MEQQRDTSENINFFSRENSAYFYSGLVAVMVVLALITSYTFFRFCARASTMLHKEMFSKVIYTNMWFFICNPSGRILNRFSKDIGTVDDVLPLNAADTFQVETAADQDDLTVLNDNYI